MNIPMIFPGTVMLAVLAAVAVEAPAQERGHEQSKPTTKALIEQLGHRDYEQREEAEKKLLAHSKAARAQLERAAKDHEDAEVRWRAQRILRGWDRGETGQRPDARGGLRRRQPGDWPQRRFDRHRQGLARIEDVDRLFDEIFQRLERELGIDIKDVRRHLERARSEARSNARDRGMQFDKQSRSMKMSITPDGVQVEIEEADRDGKVHKKTYEAEDMEAFKKAHPDVVRRFGIGGAGIRIFGGDPRFRQDLGVLRWSWPRQLRGGQPRLFVDPWVNRLPVQDPFRIDVHKRDAVRDMPPPGERLGIYVSDAPADVAEFLGLEAGQGLRVEEVVKGSLAETLGIQKGDIVFQIADRKIFAVGDVRKALRRIKVAGTVGVQVNRRGRVLALKAKKPAVLEDEKIEDQEVEAGAEAEVKLEPKKLKQRGKLR